MIVLGISKFAWAAGKGYFIEVSDFVMFYNNIRINGYLVIEDGLTNRAGKLGDLLVDDVFYLDRDNVINFCTDTRTIGTNTPGNRNCGNKDIVWEVQSAGSVYESVLRINSDDLYQLTTNDILAANDIIFSPPSGKRLATEDPIRITGCFTNDGSGSCGGNQVKTNNIYINDLSFISQCTAGTNINKMCNNDDDCGINGKCNYIIVFNPEVLTLGNIDLGSEENFENQNLCYKIGDGENCSGSVAYVSENWNFQNRYFTASVDGVTNNYDCWNPAASRCVNGARLCCFLSVNF